MITTAEEFVRLRDSNDLTEQERASNEFADINVWLDVIEIFPKYKVWVIHNKEVQIEVLELLSKDLNPNIRSAVSRKRKINKIIKRNLSQDCDENVRFALMSNTKLTMDELKEIKVVDSLWLTEKLYERIRNTQDLIDSTQ